MPEEHMILLQTQIGALGVEQNKEILEIILQYMRENKIKSYDEKTGKGLIRHALIRYGFKTKEIMSVLWSTERNFRKQSV